MMKNGPRSRAQNTAAKPTITAVESVGRVKTGSGVISFTCWLADGEGDAFSSITKPSLIMVAVHVFLFGLPMLSDSCTPVTLGKDGAGDVFSHRVNFKHGDQLRIAMCIATYVCNDCASAVHQFVRDRGGHDAFLGGVV